MLLFFFIILIFFMFEFNGQMYDVSVLGENVLFQLVKTRVRTLI